MELKFSRFEIQEITNTKLNLKNMLHSSRQKVCRPLGPTAYEKCAEKKKNL